MAQPRATPAFAAAEQLLDAADETQVTKLLEGFGTVIHQLAADTSAQVVALTAILGVAISRYPARDRALALGAMVHLVEQAVDDAVADLASRPAVIGHA